MSLAVKAVAVWLVKRPETSNCNVNHPVSLFPQQDILYTGEYYTHTNTSLVCQVISKQSLALVALTFLLHQNTSCRLQRPFESCSCVYKGSSGLVPFTVFTIEEVTKGVTMFRRQNPRIYCQVFQDALITRSLFTACYHFPVAAQTESTAAGSMLASGLEVSHFVA